MDAFVLNAGISDPYDNQGCAVDAFASYHERHDAGSYIAGDVAQIAKDLQHLVHGQRRLEYDIAQIAKDQSDSKVALISLAQGLEHAGHSASPERDTGYPKPARTVRLMREPDGEHSAPGNSGADQSSLWLEARSPRIPEESSPASPRTWITSDISDQEAGDKTPGQSPHALRGAPGRRSLCAQTARIEEDDSPAPRRRSILRIRPSTVSALSDYTASPHRDSAESYNGLPDLWPSCVDIRTSPKLSCKTGKLFDAARGLAYIERSIQGIFWHQQRGSQDSAGDSKSLSTTLSTGPGGADEAKTPSAAPERIVDRYVIPPTAALRLWFDVFSLGVLAYDYTSMPYILAWDRPFFAPASYLMLMFWTLDILLSFRTGFYDKGVLLMESKTIALNYIRTNFALDLLLVILDAGTLVLESMDTGASNEVVAGTKAARVAKISRLARIIRILRIGHAAEAYERLSDKFLWLRSSHSDSVSYVIQILIIILWINHAVSCAWYALGRMPTSDTSTSWLDDSISKWNSETYRESGFWYQYLTSMHWSLTQMTPGSMQVFPLNSAERALNIFCLIFGLLFFSSMVSSVAAKMTALRMQMLDQNKMLSELSRFLRKAMISPKLCVTVQKQVQERLRKQNRKQLKVMDVAALKYLPEATRDELKFELCCPFFFRLPFFRVLAHVEKAAVRRLASEACHWLTVHPAEVIFEAGNAATAAYVVVSGEVTYTQDPLMSKADGQTMDTIGVGTWFSEAALWCIWTHVGDMETVIDSEVMKLDAEHFFRVMMEGKVVWEFVTAYARLFHARVISAQPPHASWPSDLRVPYTGYDEIMATAPHSLQFATGLVTVEILRNQNAGFTRMYFGRSAGSFFGWRSFSGLSMTSGTGPVKDLVTELRNGTSLIVVTESGEVQRAAVVMVLRLEGPNGQLFARLGKYHEGVTSAACILPGSKIREGGTLQKLLDEELAPMKHAVQVESSTTAQQVKLSDRYGIKTKYTKHMHRAKLDTDFDLSQLPLARLAAPAATDADVAPHAVAPRAVAMDARQCPFLRNADGPRDVYAFATSESVFLYTWLSVQELDDLSSSDGGPYLKDWLCNSIDEEYLEGLIDAERCALRAAARYEARLSQDANMEEDQLPLATAPDVAGYLDVSSPEHSHVLCSSTDCVSLAVHV